MRLKELAESIPSALEPAIIGDPNTLIESLSYDSRQIFSGVCFICLKGEKSDGHDFKDDAIKRGVAAFVIDKKRAPGFAGVQQAQLTVINTRLAMPYLASAFYGNPTKSFELIGITGTNGKTTTAFMTAAIWRAASEKSGVIGTVGAWIDGKPFPTHWTVSTTPESLDLQQFFAQMVRDQVRHVALEVTSIAIDQERTAASHFNTAVFTNLTQDHLDYHGTMDAYEAAKVRLFLEYPSADDAHFIAVLNVDDPVGVRYATATRKKGIRTVTYGVFESSADFRAEDIVPSATGTQFQIAESGGDRYDVHLPIGGLFNVSNALAAVAATRSRGVSVATVQRGLAELEPVPGRFEPVVASGKDFHVLVDYAHTPDGIENVLKSARALSPKRVVVVFGCGGNRDRTKRPKMGKIASDNADVVIVTSDNPRNEDPDFIIREILDGIDNQSAGHIFVIADRREAIRKAVCEIAAPGDLVIIAGKGHETYQIVKDQTLPFDDRLVAAEALTQCS